MPLKHYVREVNKRKTDHKQAHWSDKQKFQAVTTYLLVGKWPLVSDATGIPIDTLKKWKQSDWWKEYETEIRRSNNIEVSGKLSKVREKATEVVMDRLDNGDFQFNPKTGKFSRRPVNAKVASEIMVKTIDRELILQKLEEKPETKEEAILDRLDAIASKLLQASKAKKGEVIDVDPIIERDVDGPRLVELEASPSDCDGSNQSNSSGFTPGDSSPTDTPSVG